MLNQPSTDHKNQDRLAYSVLSLAALFWGGNYVVGRLMVFHMSPILLSQYRWLITAVLLLSLYYRKVMQDWELIKTSWGSLFFLALCGQVLFPLTLYIGLQYTQPLNAAIYLSATPSLVLLINKLIFKDYISKSNVAGVVLSSAGVLYLILQGHITHFYALTELNKGDFWTMGSALCWAFYCAFLRVKNKKISGHAYVTMSALMGSAISLPITLIAFMQTPAIIAGFTLNVTVAIGLLYLVIFPSWLSYLFWNKGISIIGATRGEVYTHLVPLSGGVLSIIFLHDPLHSYHLVSAFFITCGIYLCSKHKKKITLSEVAKQKC